MRPWSCRRCGPTCIANTKPHYRRRTKLKSIPRFPHWPDAQAPNHAPRPSPTQASRPSTQSHPLSPPPPPHTGLCHTEHSTRLSLQGTAGASRVVPRRCPLSLVRACPAPQWPGVAPLLPSERTACGPRRAPRAPRPLEGGYHRIGHCPSPPGLAYSFGLCLTPPFWCL